MITISFLILFLAFYPFISTEFYGWMDKGKWSVMHECIAGYNYWHQRDKQTATIRDSTTPHHQNTNDFTSCILSNKIFMFPSSLPSRRHFYDKNYMIQCHIIDAPKPHKTSSPMSIIFSKQNINCIITNQEHTIFKLKIPHNYKNMSTNPKSIIIKGGWISEIYQFAKVSWFYSTVGTSHSVILLLQQKLDERP